MSAPCSTASASTRWPVGGGEHVLHPGALRHRGGAVISCGGGLDDLAQQLPLGPEGVVEGLDCDPRVLGDALHRGRGVPVGDEQLAGAAQHPVAGLPRPARPWSALHVLTAPMGASLLDASLVVPLVNACGSRR